MPFLTPFANICKFIWAKYFFAISFLELIYREKDFSETGHFISITESCVTPSGEAPITPQSF